MRQGSWTGTADRGFGAGIAGYEPQAAPAGREPEAMDRGSWLCPTELDRSRVVDANDRVRTIRMVGSGAVGLALVISAPWIGWWTLILFGLSALNFLNVDRRLSTSAHPERVSMCAIVITELLLAGGVVMSGGPTSPALPWMVLPAAMTAARFRPQVVIAGLIGTVVAILAATVGVDPAKALHDPVPVIAVLALLAGVVSIVWALQAAELHHRDEAILDPLTGLLNRHALMPRFIEISHQARLAHQPVCMVLCDVDGFKEVNDEYGHDRGDAVLRDVAYELRKRLRSFELVYRLGGEEFLIVLPGIAGEAGVEVAERLRAAIEQSRPQGIPITISLGVSAAGGEEVDYDTLFRAADAALYDAKRGGRNRVVAASEAEAIEAAIAIEAVPTAMAEQLSPRFAN
jgi:diguanylate cyclase (GGDEF)-like protein